MWAPRHADCHPPEKFDLLSVRWGQDRLNDTAIAHHLMLDNVNSVSALRYHPLVARFLMDTAIRRHHALDRAGHDISILFVQPDQAPQDHSIPSWGQEM